MTKVYLLLTLTLRYSLIFWKKYQSKPTWRIVHQQYYFSKEHFEGYKQYIKWDRGAKEIKKKYGSC